MSSQYPCPLLISIPCPSLGGRPNCQVSCTLKGLSVQMPRAPRLPCSSRSPTPSHPSKSGFHACWRDPHVQVVCQSDWLNDRLIPVGVSTYFLAWTCSGAASYIPLSIALFSGNSKYPLRKQEQQRRAPEADCGVVNAASRGFPAWTWSCAVSSIRPGTPRNPEPLWTPETLGTP